MTQTARKLLTTTEVSALTRTPESTLRYWRHLGTTGPMSFRVGRRVVYDEVLVLSWLDDQAAGPTAAGGNAA